MDISLFNALACLEKPDGLIALPGPESYVLAARPDHPQALARLHRMKGYSEPLLMLGRDISAFLPYLQSLPPQAEALMKRYWPLPLVMLLPKQPNLGAAFSPHDHVKVWQPESPLILDFLALNPTGLLATLCASRNDSGPICQAVGVLNAFGDDIDFIIENDALLRQAPAPTVISLQPDGAIHYLRSGSVVLD